MFYFVTTVFRWHGERVQQGECRKEAGSGDGGEQKEQSKQELMMCQKEIMICQCETNKKIHLSSVKSKINGKL